MPRYLGQVVAIEADTRKAVQRELTDAHRALGKPVLIEGLERTYRKRYDEDADLPSEGVLVQSTVREMIDATRVSLARMFDTTAARDYTNAGVLMAAGAPVADVIVNGQTLIPDAPVPYLLWLEKQLDDLMTFARKLPVHDPSTTWGDPDPRGVWRSAPVETTRTTPEPRSVVVVPPTGPHPAVTRDYTENVVRGWWTVVRLTGAIPSAERAELIRRVETVQRAVKIAREEANRAVATEPEIGARVMSYLFD